MRKNKNNKFTYAFGAAAAAVVYMVAPLPEAGAAIFKGSTTMLWKYDSTLKLDVELEADHDFAESLQPIDYLTDLSKFTSIKATLNHWALEDGVARRREITTDFFTLPNPDFFRVTVEDGNVTGFVWYDASISDEDYREIDVYLVRDSTFSNYSVPDPTFGGNMRLIDTSDPMVGTTFNGYPLSITHQKLKAVPAAGAEPNQPVPEPVPEPGFILGFITLASFMLGSRKKKEAKKT